MCKCSEGRMGDAPHNEKALLSTTIKHNQEGWIPLCPQEQETGLNCFSVGPNELPHQAVSWSKVQTNAMHLVTCNIQTCQLDSSEIGVHSLLAEVTVKLTLIRRDYMLQIIFIFFVSYSSPQARQVRILMLVFQSWFGYI